MSSSPPSGRRITVRSIACRGVKSFVPFQKPPLYAAVSLAGRREKTPADPAGGENADWEGAVFGFDFDGDGGLLQFEVKAQVPLLGNKLVGTICVPLSHLCSGGGDGDDTVPRRVSYQVLAPDGKPNGSLSFVCAVTGGASYQQPPQVYAARPEQDPSPCCAPPPQPPPSSAYPPPAVPYFEQQGSTYPPPPVSTSLYPPLQGMLPPSNYPPPPRMIDSLFPVPNSGPNSSYQLPPTLTTAYPHHHQHISNYPPRYAPAPPPSGYPPQPQMNHEFPAPTSCYPPLPPPESGSIFSVFPRSMSSPAPRSMDSESYGPRVPSGGSYYPSSGIQHHEDGASAPYYYTHPGPSYSHG